MNPTLTACSIDPWLMAQPSEVPDGGPLRRVYLSSLDILQMWANGILALPSAPPPSSPSGKTSLVSQFIPNITADLSENQIHALPCTYQCGALWGPGGCFLRLFRVLGGLGHGMGGEPVGGQGDQPGGLEGAWGHGPSTELVSQGCRAPAWLGSRNCSEDPWTPGSPTPITPPFSEDLSPPTPQLSLTPPWWPPALWVTHATPWPATSSPRHSATSSHCHISVLSSTRAWPLEFKNIYIKF